MDGQGNHPIQGQNRSFYPQPPPRPQHPQPGNQSFHPSPSIIPYPHGPPNAPYQGPPRPFLTHARVPRVHVSSQVSHSYPNSDRQQTMPLSQNVHQSLPSAPIPSSGAYPPQRHVTQSQPPQPSIGPHLSNSGSLSSNAVGSSLPPMDSLPPPPPRPPLLPPSNSLLIENGGNKGLRSDSSGVGISVSEDASSMNVLGGRTVIQIDVLNQRAEKNEVRDAENDVGSRSPADSDIDMEDDITQPDGENNNRLGINADATYASTCRDDAHSLEQAGRDELPGATEDGNRHSPKSGPFENPVRGFNMQSDSDVLPLQPNKTSNADSDALKTDKNNGSPKLKLDEFGRLVRDGDTRSDSSDSPRYARRHARRDNRKRSRSRSRSLSPYNRRSPRKRKERRGRSRSFSPKRRRSRSRSPLFRRERNQLKQCFDFQRGKCYRGAACRYSHNEPDKNERPRYERGRQHYRDVSPPTSRGKAVPDKEVNDKGLRGSRETKDPAIELTKMSPDKSSSLGSKSLQTANAVASKDSVYSDYSMRFGENESSLVREYPAQYTKLPHQVSDPSLVQLSSATKSYSNTLSVPPTKLDCEAMSPDMQFHGNSQNYSSYQAPPGYHHSHYSGPSTSSSTSFLPPPPPPVNSQSADPHNMQRSSLLWNGLPPNASLGANRTDLQYGSQMGQYQAYAAAPKPNQVLEIKEDTSSRNMHMNNLMSQHNDSHKTRDLLIGHTRQGVNPSTSLGQTLSNPSYNGKLSSPLTSVAHGSVETNQPSYMPGHDGSGNSGHLLYPSTFDKPVSSNFVSSSSDQENATQLTTKFGFGSASENVIFLTGSAPADLPRASSDQYDPFSDSIEPASNSFVKADHNQYKTACDSESIQRFDGSSVMLNMDNISQDKRIALSADQDSLLKEEIGETADAELGAVLSESHSVPNGETDTNDREIEIDQVNSPGKKKRKDSKSTKLFQNSIASFVKEILKPSWRQGNMSKEAFKTIVKKTVDKVSGAMKGRHVPKSQSNINKYIDSSRGKLTKLVMGYVDKYVNA